MDYISLGMLMWKWFCLAGAIGMVIWIIVDIINRRATKD